MHYGADGFEDLHEQLPEEKRWTRSETEWKTFRVRADAWREAKAHKEEAGRTWGEQIVREDGSER